MEEEKKDSKKKRPAVDWEAVEREYRAGLRSLRDIGAEFGCSHTAIQKRADAEGWTRDLSAKIKAAADAKVAKAEVAKEVSAETKIAERQVVEVNAAMLADKVLNQREDIRLARATVQKLWELVNSELEKTEELRRLGELMASPDENGADKLNDLYFAAIGLPQQIKNVKLLADAIKVLIELERKVLKIDVMPDPEDGQTVTVGAGRRVTLDFSDVRDSVIGK
jgi:hypothetical protein